MMDKQSKIDIVLSVKKVLDEYNILVWLDYGTLLGAVRDNDFICWDSNEFDLSIFYEQIGELRLLLPEFAKRGFKVFDIRFKDNIQIVRDGFKIDFNVYKRKGDVVVRRYFLNRWNFFGVFLGFVVKWLSFVFFRFGCRVMLFTLDKKFFESFDRMSFLGVVWFVPNNVKGYLVHHFGDNWCVPDKSYNFMKDNRNVKYERVG